MISLAGKYVLIAGAKGGLGSAVTDAFLAAGAKVIGVSRSIKADDFRHPAFSAIPADLVRAESARLLVSDVISRFGRIDVLVHVMGGFAGGQSVAETDDATFESMLDVNFRSALYVMRALLPHMRDQGAGRILAVASRQAVEPSAMVGAYSISKAALVSLVRTIAIEDRDSGISANAVLPGTMDTPGNRGSGAADPRWVKPAEVAALLVHLASDAAADITGAAIPIYGRQP